MMSLRPGRALAVTLALALAASCGARGETLHVPWTYPTIQAAIDAAEDGDTIQVAPGVYTETLVWFEKDLRLIGWGAESTIVDAQGQGRCLWIYGAHGDSEVRGFTFTNGASDSGGGLYVDLSEVVIADNTIAGCSVGSCGGGICMNLNGREAIGPVVVNNVIVDNTAGGWGGGGIYSQTSWPLIAGNLIQGNTAYEGGGIGFIASDGTVVNNVIAGNAPSGVHAGSAWRTGDSYVTLTNNTVVGNLGEGVVGGIMTLNNSIVWGNTGTDVTIRGTAVSYCNVGTGNAEGPGNLSVEPQFLDPASGDYRLLHTSPCIDAGSNDAPGLPETDKAGRPRINGPAVDMGAYEWYNQPPVLAERYQHYTVQEGGHVTLSNSATDPEGDALTYEWDLDGDGVRDAQGQTVVFSAEGYDDPGSVTARVYVTDTAGNCSVGMAFVVFQNAPPVVGDLAGAAEPVAVGQPVAVSAAFTDPGVLDTHTAIWDWGDGTQSAGTVTEADGSGSVSGTHAYVAPGVYPLGLTVLDDDGGVGQAEGQVVVYAPDGGAVTGGGWFASPAGALAPDPTVVGKASFGVNAKYPKDATVPRGQLQCQLRAARLRFHSTALEWLVVSASRATLKGTGTVNGRGHYGFLLAVRDGGRGSDAIRLRIWAPSDGTLLYDTQRGEPVDADPDTVLGGGNLTVHTK